MFPDETDFDFEAEETITTETVSTSIGRTPLFDFDTGRYVMKDGKVVECTQEKAVRQWVGFLIKTKAEKYRVYDDSGFGTYIEDYIGYKSNNLGFVVSEIEREITEKAEMNRAIDYIDGFDFEKVEGGLKIYLTVHLIDESTVEVEENV